MREVDDTVSRLLLDRAALLSTVGDLLSAARLPRAETGDGRVAFGRGEGGVPVRPLETLAGGPRPGPRDIVAATLTELRGLDAAGAAAAVGATLVLLPEGLGARAPVTLTTDLERAGWARTFGAVDALDCAAGLVASSTSGSPLEASFGFAYAARNDPGGQAPPATAFSLDLASAGLAGRRPFSRSKVDWFLQRAQEREVDGAWRRAVRQARRASRGEAAEGPRDGKLLFIGAQAGWLAAVVASPEAREAARLAAEAIVRRETALLAYVLSHFRRLRERAHAELIARFELVSPDGIEAARALAEDGWGKLEDDQPGAERVRFVISDAVLSPEANEGGGIFRSRSLG